MNMEGNTSDQEDGRLQTWSANEWEQRLLKLRTEQGGAKQLGGNILDGIVEQTADSTKGKSLPELKKGTEHS